jgi:N-acetylglucosamine kinase-like BadF-type ATPase
MRYILSLDGGGSKLNCLIADENGNLVGAGRGGPTNSFYCTEKSIVESILSAISGALTAGKVDGKDITLVHATLIASGQQLVETIRGQLHENVEIKYLSEPVISLYGAIQEEYGGLVLSGTGSFASVITGNGTACVGGWGDVFGDEGSGYYIGHQALRLCAYIDDGVLPHSLIIDRVMESYNLQSMRDMIAILQNAPSELRRTMIAAVCPIVGWCADRGDAAAVSIFKDAAFHLVRQLKTVMGKWGTYEIPISVSGGAWKASPVFFSAFKEEMENEMPMAEVRAPLFEPVVGSILLGLKDFGYPARENLEYLKKSFSSFTYPKFSNCTDL